MLQIIIVAVAIALDQLSKVWMTDFLSANGGYFELWPKVFNLLYIENRGAAFGMLQNSRWLFIIVTIIAVIAFIIYLIKERNGMHWLLKISSAMIIGGAIGNLIDRIFVGFVVDFFYFELINFAVFNVADSFVSVGAVLLGIYILFIHKFEEDNKEISDEK
jgi:signal peptidase II